MPDKSPDAFRTISEVADWLGVQPHVLRFWESKFSQVRPVKRAGGRRYYRPNDMLLLGGIRKLLHEDGLTIKGAQKVLREEGMAHVARMSQPLDPESAALSALHMEGDAVEVETHEVPSAAPEPQTGQVLKFESPQPEQGDAAAEPDPEMPAEDASPQARPNLSGTPSAQAEPEDAELEDIAEPQFTLPEVDEDGPHDTAERGDESDEPSPEESPVPSFRRSSSTPKVTEPEPGASKESPAGPSDRLPSFLQKPLSEPDSAPPPPDRPASRPPAAEATSSTEAAGSKPARTAQSAAPEPEPVQPPKPRVVVAPDPDEASIEASSGALSACCSVTRLTANQRAEMLPLVARLAALRDRMATARGQ